MNRRRHSHEEDSSLELLLDTMCNTFGGVMFIAISLFIIISAFPPDRNENVSSAPTEEVDPVKLREELESLQALLEAKRQERQLLEEELARQQETPIQRLRRELVLLERLIQEEELALRTHRLLKEARSEEAEKLAETLAKLEEKTRQLEAEKTQLEAEKMRLENELAELKSRPAERVRMEFKVMEPSSKRPFFIILSGDAAWPVGPWRNQDGDDRPDEAVTASEFIADGHSTVSCKIIPGKGVPVLAGEAMSAEFQRLLRNIPSDQVPKFFIHPSAAATIARLRTLLRRSNAIHGCIPAESDAEDFVYVYQKGVRYEY